ncbi:ATP-dependent helicase HrpB [Myxococcaceae bacterium GXIMD 01537]
MNKQGASKFDGVLADKAQGAQGVDAAQAAQRTQAAQATQRTEQVRGVENVNKTDKAAMNKVHPSGVDAKSEGQKAGGMMSSVVNSLEKGHANLEKLMSQAASGKQFSNAELLGLQASMYKYTQELDLTSKVVEKATSGLKDTLKTQV